MTKNNEYILPKEKPFETVYELKNENEVPSFEEFMKSYEGNVNYADLSDGSVGEVKGYGPCWGSNKKYWCTCNCGRSDCDCKYDSNYGHER